MNPDDIDIWIVDSSALIATKSIVSVTNQWDAFKHLEQMVQNGQIAMPRQVINEVSKIAQSPWLELGHQEFGEASNILWTRIMTTSKR